jgi:glyceraldehyde 3-phosphate dehydrogenase
VVKVVKDSFGVKKGLMTTIHSYTNDQRILDLPHKDLRRARAAALNMIPTTTGAAKAVGLVIPDLKGKMDGLAIRVPTPTVSIVDVVMQVEKATSKEEVNKALKDAAGSRLKGILEVSEQPLVSLDFKGNPASSIVDAENTFVFDDMIKVLSWYDNEWGYSCRIVDLIEYMAKQGL